MCFESVWAPGSEHRDRCPASSGLASLEDAARRATVQFRQSGQMGLNPKRSVFPWFSLTSQRLSSPAHLPKVGFGGGGAGEQGGGGEVGLQAALSWRRAMVGKARLSCLRNFVSPACMSK